MTEPEKPKPDAPKTQQSAEVVRLEHRLLSGPQPADLSPADATKVVRALATSTANIVLLEHAKRRTKERKITRRQIELCVQRGAIAEGPFLNPRGHWQLNMQRHAAGEQITVVIAIEWAIRLLVISAF
jgi:hypothetical protein